MCQVVEHGCGGLAVPLIQPQRQGSVLAGGIDISGEPRGAEPGLDPGAGGQFHVGEPHTSGLRKWAGGDDVASLTTEAPVDRWPTLSVMSPGPRLLPTGLEPLGQADESRL